MRKILHMTLVGIMMLICGTAYADAYKTLSFPDDNKENNKFGSYTDTWTAKIDCISLTQYKERNTRLQMRKQADGVNLQRMLQRGYSYSPHHHP